jgi:TPR repeat protein
MNRSRRPAWALTCAAVFASAAVLAVGCSSSTAPPASSSGAKTAESRPACRGTLGFEAAQVTKRVRARLKLPADAAGVVVVSVLPGGPAEAAGIRTDDVVEKIGTDAIGNDCDWSRAAFGRACEPVTLAVVRGEQRLELSVVPVDEDRFLGDACRGGNATACFRTGWLLWSRDRGDGHALEIFEEACKAGSADACAYAGLQLSLSSERASEAPPLLERSCELDSGAGCAHLGFLYATSPATTTPATSVVAKDDRRAVQLYAKSCALGDAQGCYNSGLMADEGRGIRQDAS